jgi:hypothetical protein
MDSLDLVEAVLLIKEVGGTEVPGNGAAVFGSPGEIVDRLEPLLANRRANNSAAALLRKLAKKNKNPGLAEGLDGTWRRGLIAAIVREIFRE